MPNDFQAGGIRQRDILVRHDTDRQINVVQWRDKRDVFLLTTTEQPAMAHVPARRPGAPPVERLNVIRTYNHTAWRKINEVAQESILEADWDCHGECLYCVQEDNWLSHHSYSFLKDVIRETTCHCRLLLHYRSPMVLS